MTLEQEPKEKRKRYFTPLQVSMIEWMLFDYDDRKSENANKLMAKDLDIEVTEVEGVLKWIDRAADGNRVRALTLVSKVAVANREINIDRIPTEPTSKLNKKEEDLATKFSEGKSNSVISKEMQISLEELKRLSTTLFKKFNTRSRYLFAAIDAKRELTK